MSEKPASQKILLCKDCGQKIAPSEIAVCLSGDESGSFVCLPCLRGYVEPSRIEEFNRIFKESLNE